MQDLKEFVRRNEDRELDEEEKVKEEEIMAEDRARSSHPDLDCHHLCSHQGHQRPRFLIMFYRQEFLLLFFCVFITVKMKKNRISTDPASSVSVIVSLLNDITACNTA